VELLRENSDIIDWSKLSTNTSPNAVGCWGNPDRIDWYSLSENTADSAVALLRENPDKINWTNLSINTSDSALSCCRKTPIRLTGSHCRTTQISRRRSWSVNSQIRSSGIIYWWFR
jgi:hypothetical protein